MWCGGSLPSSSSGTICEDERIYISYALYRLCCTLSLTSKALNFKANIQHKARIVSETPQVKRPSALPNIYARPRRRWNVKTFMRHSRSYKKKEIIKVAYQCRVQDESHRKCRKSAPALPWRSASQWFWYFPNNRLLLTILVFVSQDSAASLCRMRAATSHWLSEAGLKRLGRNHNQWYYNTHLLKTHSAQVDTQDTMRFHDHIGACEDVCENC